MSRHSESESRHSESAYRRSESAYRRSESAYRHSESAYRHSESAYRRSESAYRRSESMYRRAEGASRLSKHCRDGVCPVSALPLVSQRVGNCRTFSTLQTFCHQIQTIGAVETQCIASLQTRGHALLLAITRRLEKNPKDFLIRENSIKIKKIREIRVIRG
jgi:hypothetical protein